MGLSITVGLLTDLEDDPESLEHFKNVFSEMNDVLEEEGQPRHEEPASLPELDDRAAIRGFGYSSLHHLRRVFAYVEDDEDWKAEPVKDGEDPSEDPLVEEESEMLSSHLLCHSDCEGFYLPIDFDELIMDAEDDDRIEGGLLGSSYRLKEELIQIAPSMGISLDGENLSDAEAKRINEVAESGEGLSTEYMVWIALFEAARLSIEHKTAIHFG